jgi:hypothetical protein
LARKFLFGAGCPGFGRLFDVPPSLIFPLRSLIFATPIRRVVRLIGFAQRI